MYTENGLLASNARFLSQFLRESFSSILLYERQRRA